MNRIHLVKVKKNKGIKSSNKVIIISILVLIGTIYLLNLFSKKAVPLFLEYSKSETRKIATLVINNSIKNQISNDLLLNEIFTTKKDNSGNIESIDLNPLIVNQILSKITNNVELNLNYLESGKIDLVKLDSELLKNYDHDSLSKGIIYELPSGIIFNNVILTNVLPKIPVRLSLVGSIVSKFNTKIEQYGINNALIKLYIDMSVEVKVILPFISDVTDVEVSVPIAMKIIEGKVPNYYMQGYTSTPYLDTNIK